MYKDILVELDDRDSSMRRIDYAISLSQRLDAHLTGLYLVKAYMPPPEVCVYLNRDMEAQIYEDETNRAKTAIERFCKAAEREEVEYGTRTDKGPAHDQARQLSLHGRYADLIVIGQPDPNQPGDGLDPGNVVLSIGAPVVIVPYISSPKTTAEHITIAWNASRESARAVRDAMPLLERAKSVDVVCFKPTRGSGHGELPGADIGLHLSRHDIKVDVQILDGEDIDVGNALLSHVADRGSDFLVMGGYGHSRLREAVLGGATRTILQSMTVPVLMAH